MSSRSSQSSRRDKHRSPIHLNSNSFNNHLTNSSDSSDNNHATSTPKKKAPLSPITEVNTPLPDGGSRVVDYFDELLEKSKLTNGQSKGFTSTEDLDLIPTSDKLSSKHSKSAEAMHSSQMPAERPALTKGAAVNKMIKRLSIERLSPPAQVIQAGGFSYTHPVSPLNSPTKHLTPPLTVDEPSDIVYAQVVCNESKNVDGSKTITSKETVHNTLKKMNRQSASPPPNHKSIDYVDHFVTTATPTKLIDDSLVTDDEPIIKPNIRYQIPRYNSITELHQPDSNMRDADLTLSNRREILESRIKSRIGGLHFNSGDNNNHSSNHIRRTSSSPPTTAKRYHKYGSNELINRFSSPERSHHQHHRDVIRSPSPSKHRDRQHYADSTLRKKSYYYSKHNGDSGIEVDSVSRNNKKNGKYSSRFNIG